jgi:hypothetical protein
MKISLERLKQTRENAVKQLELLQNELQLLYSTFPALLPKDPSGMSTADKLRFSQDLIEFWEVKEQYK